MTKKPSAKRRKRLKTRDSSDNRKRRAGPVRRRMQTSPKIKPAVQGSPPNPEIPRAVWRCRREFEGVKELAEEGQFLEAQAVDGVEKAPGSDAGAAAFITGSMIPRLRPSIYRNGTPHCVRWHTAINLKHNHFDRIYPLPYSPSGD